MSWCQLSKTILDGNMFAKILPLQEEYQNRWLYVTGSCLRATARKQALQRLIVRTICTLVNNENLWNAKADRVWPTDKWWWRWRGEWWSSLVCPVGKVLVCTWYLSHDAVPAEEIIICVMMHKPQKIFDANGTHSGDNDVNMRNRSYICRWLIVWAWNMSDDAMPAAKMAICAI